MGDADLADAITQNERLAKEIRATAESMEREFAGGGAASPSAGAGGKPEPRVARYQPHAQVPALSDGEASAVITHMRDWDYGPGGVFQRQEELGGHALFHTPAQGIHQWLLPFVTRSLFSSSRTLVAPVTGASSAALVTGGACAALCSSQ